MRMCAACRSPARPARSVWSSGNPLVLVDDAAEDVATDDLAVCYPRSPGGGAAGRVRGRGGAWLRCNGGRTRRARPRDVVVRRREGGRDSPGGWSARISRRRRSPSARRPAFVWSRCRWRRTRRRRLAVNLVSRSRTRNRKLAPGVFEVGGEVTGHLGDPGTVGVGGDAEQVHPSPVDLDHEEHVVSAAT